MTQHQRLDNSIFSMLRKLFPNPIAKDEDVPLSRRGFSRMVWFWHAVTALLYLGLAISVAYVDRAQFGLRTVLVMGACVLLLIVYTRFYVYTRSWPVPIYTHTLYFGGVVALALLAARHYPQLAALLSMLMGQGFGLLSPVGAIGLLVMVFVMVYGMAVGWDSALLTASHAFWFIFSLAGSIAMYVYFYGVLRTSSDRARLIRELETTKAELEASRVRDAELAVLRERERIARDMHDSLGHALVTLSVQLEAAQRLYAVDPARGAAQLEQLKTLMRDGMAQLRGAISGLRESGLAPNNLGEAITRLALDVGARARVDVSCDLDPLCDTLPAPLRDAIWYVTKEALTNIEKHAAARRVEIRLSCGDRCVRLAVRDDGIGFDSAMLAKPGHFGIVGMRERAAALGGQLTVDSDGGTSVVLAVPLESR